MNKKKSIVYPIRPCKINCPALMRRIQKERDQQNAQYGKPQPAPSDSSDTLPKL